MTIRSRTLTRRGPAANREQAAEVVRASVEQIREETDRTARQAEEAASIRREQIRSIRDPSLRRSVGG